MVSAAGEVREGVRCGAVALDSVRLTNIPVLSRRNEDFKARVLFLVTVHVL